MKKLSSISLISILIMASCLLASCSNKDTWEDGFIQNNPRSNLINMQKIQNDRNDGIKYGKNTDGYIDLRATKVHSEYINKLPKVL